MSKPVVAVNQGGRVLAVPGPEGPITMKPGAISEPLDPTLVSDATREKLEAAGIVFHDPKSRELAAIRKAAGQPDGDARPAIAELTAENAALRKQVASLAAKVEAAQQIAAAAAALEKRNGELEAELATLKTASAE